MYWDANGDEDAYYTDLAFYREAGSRGTYFKYIWGSEVLDNRVIEFAVTDMHDFDHNRGATKISGMLLDDGWEEACNTYWRRRRDAVERLRQARRLQRENPQVDFSDMTQERRDSGMKVPVSEPESDSSEESKDEEVVKKKQELDHVQSLLNSLLGKKRKPDR